MANKTSFDSNVSMVQELLDQQNKCILEYQNTIEKLQGILAGQNSPMPTLNGFSPVYIDPEKIKIGKPNFMKPVVTVIRSRDSWTITKIAAYVVSFIVRLMSSAYHDEYERQEVQDKTKEKVVSNNISMQAREQIVADLNHRIAIQEPTAQKQLLLPALQAIETGLALILQSRVERKARARQELIANALLDDPLASFNELEAIPIANENTHEAYLLAQKEQLETELTKIEQELAGIPQ